uniref:protein O-GlcNAcase n=1 Tax=Aceria tosichella TaxID=561515 RepID=A0A6G1SJD5_9ACAR
MLSEMTDCPSTSIISSTSEEQRANSNNNDNNDQFICGVVEGFYGKPWTFHQRRDLFKQLKKLKLNSFMYAPKGDAKHRSKWRQLYNDTEARELKILIDEAAANGIDFYYSLAPGLDMVYSEPDDSEQLCRKFDQLKSLGCKSFALLFDDIEPSLSHEKDRVIFKNNYASAQVSVTNLIYEYLGRPKFLFCPTEYCESRAVPNVLNSLYLNTIGTGLHQGIDIMWSGSRVISRYITEESIKELNSVIRRRVLIWENLHANDYDKKRVYLGPYSGRSTKIIPQLRGVLTNPNCEYEANYIAIHTLAQWKQCSKDSNPHNRCNQASNSNHNHLTSTPPFHTSSTGTSSAASSDSPSNSQASKHDESVYDPDQALVKALSDWLPHVLSPKSLPVGASICNERDDNLASDQISKEESVILNATQPSGPAKTHTTATNLSRSASQEMKGVEDANQDIKEEDMPDADRDRSPAADSATSKSDMDTSGSSTPAPPQQQQPATIKNVDSTSCDSCEMQDASSESPSSTLQKQNELTSSQLSCLTCSATSLTQQQPSRDYQPELNIDSLALLVDFFYLPFEHGVRGYAFLSDIKWLIEHSVVFLNPEDSNKKEADDSSEHKSELVQRWLERAGVLNDLCICINKIVDTLVHDCPNKLLMSELYPYLRNLHEIILMTIDFIRFLRFRRSCLDRFYYSESPKPRDPIAEIDLEEPWAHKGGLVGDVQRLISS